MWRGQKRPGCLQRGPDILIHIDGLPSSPDESTGEECEEEQHAVVPLGFAPGHVELVEEPVEVQERRRELVEDEG